MSDRLKNTVNILVPAGALGSGVREGDVAAGLAAGAHGIAIDAGSTDSGPAYLATGRSKYSRDAVKSDLRILMKAQASGGIPLLVGSCGTSGCDMAVDWTRDIALEIAREEGLRPCIALLYSEQDPTDLAARARAGGVRPLAPMTNEEPDFASCSHVVALMGPEPYMAALEAGADIVLGGRTTDTAVLAALPLLRGAGAGPAWHAGKTAECGGQCTVNPREGSVMIRVGHDAFEVEPLSRANACSPETVSAHMLYENADPFRLTEPGGTLDVTAARYQAIDARMVRVTGSRWELADYTMKLEGASGGMFQTIMLVGIQDPLALSAIDRLLAGMHAYMTDRVGEAMRLDASEFTISLRPYGWNAVSGAPVASGRAPPHEIGLLFVATAATQALATQIAKTCNPIFFHFPAAPNIELPSYAFPFSPAEIERGQVYDFRLNHVVAVDRPDELVRSVFIDPAETAHA